MGLTTGCTSERTGLPSADQPWRKYFTAASADEVLPQTTLYRYLFDCNRGEDDATALRFFGTDITYGEFFKNIRCTADGFAALGVKPGDIVTIFSSNTPETVYCFFALNYIGAIPSMEYVTVSDKEALAAVRRNDSKVVLILDVLLDKFACVLAEDCVKTVVSLPLGASMPLGMRMAVRLKTRRSAHPGVTDYRSFLDGGKNTAAAEAPFCAGAPVAIVHSGGTTGSPKGVLLCAEGLIYIAWAFMQNSPDAKKHDIYMPFIPLFHAFGLGMGLMAPLSQSMTVVLTPKFDEAFLLTELRKNKPNHIMVGSSHIPTLMKDPLLRHMDLSFLKTCGFGGSKLPEVQERELALFLAERNSPAKPSAGYGMSELSSAVCTERNVYYGKVGSVGLPLCRANVRVLDPDTGKELGYGQSGELCFASPGLMLGYYKNERETADAIFTDEDGVRWLHSGDVGYVDEDGFVFITGRIKRIYSTRSERGGTLFKLFPDYVANVIDEAEGVSQSAVVCIPHEDFRNIAVAYVVLRDGADKDAVLPMIKAHMEKELPAHAIPKDVRFLDSLPLTQIGKIDYHVLEKDAEDNKPKV